MDSAPLYFDVTDDGLDAPDGAVVFVEQYGAKYERVGGTWRLAPMLHVFRDFDLGCTFLPVAARFCSFTSGARGSPCRYVLWRPLVARLGARLRSLCLK